MAFFRSHSNQALRMSKHFFSFILKFFPSLNKWTKLLVGYLRRVFLHMQKWVYEIKYIHFYFAICNYFKYYGCLVPYVKTVHKLAYIITMKTNSTPEATKVYKIIGAGSSNIL